MAFEVGRPIFDELPVIIAELERTSGQPVTFVIPDIKIAHSQAVSKDSVILARKMSLPKFTMLFQSLLVSFGLSHAEAKAFTSRSLRRFLPTVADIVRAPIEVKQQVGNWEEVPATAATCGATATHSMAARYSGDRTLTAADTKARLLEAIFIVSKKHKSQDVAWQDVRMAGLSWAAMTTWPLPHLLLQVGPGQILPAKRSAGALVQLTEAEVKAGLFLSDEDVADEVLSHESSPSESDAEMDADSLEWFRLPKRPATHLLRSFEEASLIPWCRDSQFASVRAERGNGLDLSMSLCARCVQRCPKKLCSTIHAFFMTHKDGAVSSSEPP